ncbi:MAG: citrate transporter [Clostridia bacterium]|nr:citrate transporter [Clostridia bacterium]
MHTIATFLRRNTVLCIAMLAAALTGVAVPPDAQYLGYFDGRTLCCLFCTLAVVCALKNIRFFQILAHRIVRIAGNTRSALMLLVTITFVGSMLIANDMALLTFLPLGYYILTSTGQERLMAFTFILQNIAANLGGMLTPFGNPQNLYLYSRFAIPTGEFMSIMLLPFLLAITMILGCCLLVRKEPMQLRQTVNERLPRGRTALYLALFAFSIALVFRIIDWYWLGLIIIPAVLLFADRDALKKVDYPLLLTFVCFFIFAGNMGRIPAVREFFSSLLSHSVLLVSALSCQVISNVPSAILLSQFTDNYRELLLGVNIGGAGTLVASLASLITFREFTSHQKEKTGRYLALFSLMNFAFLGILAAFCLLVVL